MTIAQDKLRAELRQTIHDGINERIATEVNAQRIDSALHLQAVKSGLTEDLMDYLVRNHRIGRPRRKFTEINP